jgi:hypothetical protein
MPGKSMFSRPIGMFLFVVAIVIGVLYVMYPAMFRNEEGESFVHPVPPLVVGEDDDGYHYREEC